MNKNTKTLLRYLLPTTVLGLAGMFLRHLMLTTAIDDKGLLIRFNLPSILLWIVTACVCLWLLLALRKLTDSKRYREMFPKSVLCGVLSVAAGVMMAFVILFRFGAEPLAIRIIGLLAAVGMIFVGTCRFRGLHPNFLCHGFICLFFIYRLVNSYQDWNANPQLHSYAIQMLACVLLMLGSFHRACCDANIFNRRKLGFSLLMAVYLCLVSISDPENSLYYGAAALWAAGNICQLDPLPVRAAPAVPPVTESEMDDAAFLMEISQTEEAPIEESTETTEEIVEEPESKPDLAELDDDLFFEKLLAGEFDPEE